MWTVRESLEGVNFPRSRTYFSLIALLLLPLQFAKSGGPPPMVPSGYRLAYNLNGDHVFRFVPGRRSPGWRVTLLPGERIDFSPQSQPSLSYPLLTLTDLINDTNVGYLAVIETQQRSTNTPLQIANTATTNTGPGAQTAQATGYQGIELSQLAAAVSGTNTNVNSPIVRWTAQVYNGTNSIADSWYFQNVPGSGNNPQQIFGLFHLASNSNNNLTFQIPSGSNVATPPADSNEITVAPGNDPNNSPGAAFFAGGSSTSTSASAVASPGYFEGGSLSNASPSASAKEGPVEIIQFYLTGSVTNNTLGCLSATQTISTCTTTGNAENWVGVINTSAPPSRGGSTAVERSGRTTIASAASHQYTANDFVCKDDANAGDVIDNGATPCPIGESVGTAVGDASSSTSHAVDIVQGESVSGAVSQGLVLQFTCAGQDTAGSTTYLNGQTCGTTSGTNSTEFNLPYQSGTYTFRNLYVGYAGTAALTDSVTLYIGGTASTLTCNPDASGAAPCPDVTHTPTITPSTARNYSIRLSAVTGNYSDQSFTTFVYEQKEGEFFGWNHGRSQYQARSVQSR